MARARLAAGIQSAYILCTGRAPAVLDRGVPVAQILSSTDRASAAERAALPISERPLPDLITEIPGPKAREKVAFDEAWTSPSLPRAYPIVPVRGQGMAIEDVDGNLFLDFAAGIAVNSTGHGHPRVIGAIKEQASELVHYSASDFYVPIYAETAKALADIAPISGRLRTYLGNSGAEAVEVAMKLARHYTGRP
jgi:4-aminobutyrate aminotransferase